MQALLAKLRLWRGKLQPEPGSPCKAHAPQWPLSMKLLSWNDHDHLHLFDVVTGIQVFGVTGSTKSSTTVETLNRAFMLNGCAAIFFSVKPDDPQNYYRQAVECGREKDVVWFGPKHATTLNFVNDGLGLGDAGVASNVTTLLSTLSGMATGKGGASGGGGGREDGGFWEKMDNRLIAACTQLLMRAGQPVTTINIERLVMGIPRSREQVGEDDWQKRSYVFVCLRDADSAATNPDDREDVGRLADYFLIDLAQLGDKLRGTVQTSVGATLDLFNHQITRRLLSSPTPNFRMEMLYQEGKILIIDMPVMVYGALAVAIQKTLKFIFQLSQNRRDVGVYPCPVVMGCDEAQAIVDLDQDAAFGCTARSTRTICLYSTQSISNYLAMSSGQQGEARVFSLLANLQCQIFHQSDSRTIEHAQTLCGKRKRLLMQGGMQQPGGDWVSSALGLGTATPGSTNAGYSENLDFCLQAEHFQRLAKGGPPHWTSDAIVYQGGKHFVSSGRPYLFVRLQQRPNSL